MKSNHAQAQKEAAVELEEASQRNAKLHRQIDALKKEVNASGLNARDENSDLERKLGSLKGKDRRLREELAEYKRVSDHNFTWHK